jgi:hypothetical protein
MEGWNLYGCLNFKLSYYICNWYWIWIVTLKVEVNVIIEYFNYINQAYSSCVYYFIDGGNVENVVSMVFDAKG